MDRDLVSRKLNSVYGPVFASICQAQKNTKNVATVMYIALFVNRPGVAGAVLQSPSSLID